MAGSERKRPRWIRHSGIGVEFAAAFGGFALAGWWVDRHYRTGPWGLVIGAALGLVGATYNLVRQSLAAFKEAAEDDRRGEQTRSSRP